MPHTKGEGTSCGAFWHVALAAYPSYIIIKLRFFLQETLLSIAETACMAIYIHMTPEAFKFLWCRANRAHEGLATHASHLPSVIGYGSWLRALNNRLADSVSDSGILLNISDEQRERNTRKIMQADRDMDVAMRTEDHTLALVSARELDRQLQIALNAGPAELKPTLDDMEGTNKP